VSDTRGIDAHLTKDDLANIGLVAMQAAILEETIEIGVWLALGVPFNLGPLITRGRTASARLDLLRGFLKGISPEDANKIDAICNAAADALRKRNTVLHGVVIKLADADTLAAWNREKDQTIPLSDAPSVAVALSAVEVDLMRLLQVIQRKEAGQSGCGSR